MSVNDRLLRFSVLRIVTLVYANASHKRMVTRLVGQSHKRKDICMW